MKPSRAFRPWLLALAAAAPAARACPFARSADDRPPDDEVHRTSLRRRLLDTPAKRAEVRAIVDRRTAARLGREPGREPEAAPSVGGGGGDGAGLSARSLATDDDPTRPFAHVPSAPLRRQLLVSYATPAALSSIENHVRSARGRGADVEFRGHKRFAKVQRRKHRGTGGRGGLEASGRDLQDDEEGRLGYVVVATDEDAAAYDALEGVHAERDVEVHIDGHAKERQGVKKHVDEEDLAHGRHLQESRPWGIEFVNVTGLWELDPPASPIAICVVDTGYDLGHVDLPEQGVTGWEPNSLFNQGSWNVDGHGHGTHCAGTIGAIGNNDEGVVGVWNDPTKFRFHIAKGLSDTGSGAGADVLAGVQSCVDAGAKVISMSLGCDNCHSAASEAFYDDIYDQNVLIVAAAGNSGDVRDHFPSGYPAVMSVASLDDDGTLSSFSTRNDQTEIAGPGRSVHSTVPGDNYAFFSGTSMATPHVAGVAAILWSHYPECTNNQIRNALLHASVEPPDDSAQNPQGWDIFYGHGNVNAGAAYQLLSERGCVGAGGRFPDTANNEELSDQAPGGSEQLQFGCTSDDHCQEDVPNPCLGTQACDLATNTCFEVEPGVNCDDGLACTVDECDPTRDPSDLCVHTDVVCDDGDVCNGVLTCDDATGTCVQDSAAIVCELETECNLATCDAVTGECSYTTRECDDGNPCTSDTCDPNIGCVFSDPEPLCCGNGVCEVEASETEESCAVDCNPSAPPGGAPAWRELFPWPDDIISGDVVTLKATVFDDDIRRVSFRVRSPDGTTTNFSPGTLVSTVGDVTTWTFDVSSTQKGVYGYQISMSDQSGNTVRFPDTSLTVEGGSGGSHGGGGGGENFIEFVVADSTSDLVAAARAEIASIINADPANLAAKFVRMAFHDCVGGCDGCIDLTNGDNFGLEYPIDVLEEVATKFNHVGMTRADIWVLASLEAARGAQANGDDEPFDFIWFGRPTCEDTHADIDCVDNDCSAKRGPHRDLPSPHLTTHALISFFNDAFGFTEAWQTVAIMGAHTLGILSRENSGFDGPNGWLGNTNRLNNGYYNDIVGGTLTDFETGNLEAMMNAADWQNEFIDNSQLATPDRWQWQRRTPPEHFVMLNADIALVRDLSGFIDDEDGQVSQCQFRCGRNGGNGCPLPRCPHAVETLDVAAEYKHNNTKFLSDFQSVYMQMLEAGADTSEGCLDPPCALPGTFTPRPTHSPTVAQPSSSPTPRPTPSPTIAQPTRAPSDGIVTEAEYDAIEADVAALSAAFGNDDVSRAHFLGGIVRLVAHDFMDFSANDEIPMGSDGCIDMAHPDNSGLPQDVWCDDGCPLTDVYNANFAHISKADFWIAAGNAVIKIASNNALDMKGSYRSGRVDADSCVGQGARLPAASGCDAVEAVFVDRLGLTRTDAVALLGAHTIGRGNTDFSGHNGIWVDTVQQSVVFDKRYYEEGFRRAWIPRNNGTPVQDWTWGNADNNGSPRFFLNADMCLFFDIETTFPCCTDVTQGNRCDRNGLVLSGTPCPAYEAESPRAEFAAATNLFAGHDGNGNFNNNDQPFYDAFAAAWEKATTNGLSGLQSLQGVAVVTSPPTASPTPGPTPNPTPAPIVSICEDIPSFIDGKGRTRDCTWAVNQGKCGKFGHLCPVSCNICSSI